MGKLNPPSSIVSMPNSANNSARFMVEHYADGDLVNQDTPLGYGPAGHEGLAVWGPDVPKEFLE